MKHRRHNVRLVPNDFVRSQFEIWHEDARFVRNLCWEQRLNFYAKRLKAPSGFDQCKQLTELKEACPWLYRTPNELLQGVIRTLDRSHKRTMNRLAGWPTFTKFNKHSSSVGMFCQLRAPSVKNGYLNIPKVGWVRFRGLKNPEGRLKHFNIFKTADQWYASLMFEMPDVMLKPAPTGSIVGIDRGITELYVDSNGHHESNPRWYARSMKKLARLQRAHSRKEKGSKNRLKAQLKLARAHKRVADQRSDALHKMSTTIAKNHGIVVLEDMKPSKMVHRNHGLSRAIMDAGWSMLQNMLKYKLEMRGGKLILISPAYTSQTCRACGYIDRENRRAKQFHCLLCHHTEDADANAASNILTKGITVLKLRTAGMAGIACGEVIQTVSKDATASMKQESLENEVIAKPEAAVLT